MEKEFVPYEQALALKELNAYIECFGFYWFNGSTNIWVLETKEYEDEYSKTISAPTFSQAFRFFREKYDLVGWIRRRAGFHKEYSWYISDFNDDDPNEYEFDLHIETYEEAELACLNKLIEIVKNDNIQK